jgi:uncharacterized protein YcbK (DUF882 family)
VRGVASVRPRVVGAWFAALACALLATATSVSGAPARPPAPAAKPRVTLEPSPRARPRESLSSFYRGGKRPEPSPQAAPAPQRPGLFAGRDARSQAARAPVSATYRESVRTWHEASGHGSPTGPRGEPCLLLVNLNAKERATLCPLPDGGGFSASDREAAAMLFREPGSENAHPVHPRLLALLLDIQEHFHAGEIRLLSGYRSPWEGNSNHGKGRAADIVVPGASDDAVASYARGLGFVGVGIYPTSRFVHVDVRDASYFWVDASAPGRPHRERGILAALAKESDERAKARRERPTFGPVVRADATGWIAARAGAASAGTGTPDGAADVEPVPAPPDAEAAPSTAEETDEGEAEQEAAASTPERRSQN